MNWFVDGSFSPYPLIFIVVLFFLLKITSFAFPHPKAPGWMRFISDKLYADSVDMSLCICLPGVH